MTKLTKTLESLREALTRPAEPPPPPEPEPVTVREPPALRAPLSGKDSFRRPALPVADLGGPPVLNALPEDLNPPEGTPSPTDPQAAAETVAETAEREGPQAGAEALQSALEANPDPAYQQALLVATSETVTGLTAQATSGELPPDEAEATWTALAAAAAYAETLPEDEREPYLDTVASAAVQAAGSTVIALEESGDPTGADAVLDNLFTSLGQLRPGNNAYVAVSNALAGWRSIDSPSALDSFNLRVTRALPQLSPALRNALGGLGAALGFVGFAAASPSLSTDDVPGIIQGALGAYGATQQTANVLSSILGNSVSTAAQRSVPLLTAAVAAIGAYRAFEQGEYVEGVANSAVALGAGLLVVPGGQVIGGLLIAAGSVALLLSGDEGDAESEERYASALERMGVPHDVAVELAELDNGRHFISQAIAAEAEAAGLTTREYLDWLSEQDPYLVEQFVRMARSIQYDDDTGELMERSPGGQDLAPAIDPTPLTLHGLHQAWQAYLESEGLEPR